MYIKTIFIISLLFICGCNSANTHNAVPDTAPQTSDSPAVRFKQECLADGYDEQSKAFFDCMEKHWAKWKQSNNSVANNDQEADAKELAASINKCKRLLATKKLKSNYEHGECALTAFEKYFSIYPITDKAAFEMFRTDILLTMVRLDKKEITKNEAKVLTQQSFNKLMQADSTAIVEAQRQKTALAQQAYQNQLQQQQYEAARSAAMTQGYLGILQNYMQERQSRHAYIPQPVTRQTPITTECNTFSGVTRCRTE